MPPIRLVFLAAALSGACQLFLDASESELVEDSEGRCADGIDNDGDGRTDCSDSGCLPFCADPRRCGDGVLDAGEQCDDGNNAAEDGCEPGCALICGADTPADRALLADNGSCYLGFRAPLDWKSAAEVCAAKGAHLVTIGDDVENALVRRLSKNKIWIGLNDLGVEAGIDPKAFVWVTGEPNVFTSFADTQPDDEDDEDCVHFRDDDTTDWNDFDCTAPLEYVCER
jgi:cysteine-rich repeat protein